MQLFLSRVHTTFLCDSTSTMRFSKQFALSLFIGFTAASPTLKARGVDPDDAVEPNNPVMSTVEQCTQDTTGASDLRYNVVINDATKWTKPGECADGFQDNLNGQGCDLLRFVCNYDEDGTTANVNFSSRTTWCDENLVKEAIELAFGGKRVECEDINRVKFPID